MRCSGECPSNSGDPEGVQIEYSPHSMMHRAIVSLEPTKLELLDGFEKVDAGYKFRHEESNIYAQISGRDWSEKRILIYGGKSTEEAESVVTEIIHRIENIERDVTITETPQIKNIAVHGDFHTNFQLESISTDLRDEGINVEYEPEQFPALIARIDSPKATFMLFSTGRFVIQGLQDLDLIDKAIKKFLSLIGIDPC